MAIKVADDGQVTIPRHMLQQLGIGPGSEVDVRHAANGTLIVEKVVPAEALTVIPDRFDLVRGIAGRGPSTDEIMAELRGD